MSIPLSLLKLTWPQNQNKSYFQNNSATLFNLVQHCGKGTAVGVTSIACFRKRKRLGFDL